MRLGTPGLKIGIFPKTALAERRSFFFILGKALQLAFEPRNVGDYSDLSGILLFSDSPSSQEVCRASGLNVLHFRISGPQQSVHSKTVKFSNTDALHLAFRGQVLTDPSLTTFCTLTTGQHVFASIDGFPVWIREQLETQSVDSVGVDLPSCDPDGFFNQFFRDNSWFRVLPLLSFLKACLPASCWLETQPRASIIVDDPNLHGTRYGFIDYKNFARHAEQHNYHASIATIPLDFWYTNAAAVAIFRDNPKRLSLLLHGVNHTLNELGQECSDAIAVATLAEGLRRAERFERKSRLSVARIIAAPHGAFADHFASAMALLEFEGACVSLPSLLYWNSKRQWPADTGSNFAQSLGTGSLPVFHRIGPLDIDIRLLTFLEHPVIVYAHHNNCVGNYGQFEKWANSINGIGKPKWCSVGDIARSNYYYSRRPDGTLLILLYSRHCELDLPPETSCLEFQPTPFNSKHALISLDALRAKNEPVVSGNLTLSCNSNSKRVSVRVIPSRLLSHLEIGPLPTPWWAYIRRIITEVRDRTLPLMPSGLERKS